jgi:hypothetical protein
VLIKVRRNYLTTTWHLGCSYPINRHMLNRRYDFRRDMQKLGKLAAAKTQIVMLTATLPPSKEDELFRQMYVERDQVELFRAATARTNVAY